MIRNDLYTLYSGHEYRIGKYTKDTVNLISNNSFDKKNGFEHFTSNPDLYRKTIPVSEMGEVFHVNTLAEYKNVTVAVIGESDTQYLLYIGGEVGNGLGFENIGRSEYQKWINKEDVTNVHEVKRPSPHFFGS